MNLVNILFNVRDKRGGLVGNLNKDDFTIFEDGKEQQIKYFNRETDLPLTIGLLIDVSASQRNLIDIEKNAAYQFFGKVLRKQDLAFLISFRRRRRAAAGLHQLAAAAARRPERAAGQLGRRRRDPGPVPTISQPRGTILYDAVYLAAHDQLKGQVGRKVLVLITDGEDQGSRYNIQRRSKPPRRPTPSSTASTTSIAASTCRHGMIFGGGSDSALRQMSEDTGGHVFHIDRKMTLQDAFDELQEEMRSQYAIGYTPTNPVKDGTFRKVEIHTKNKDWKVQARKGYYASKSDN